MGIDPRELAYLESITGATERIADAVEGMAKQTNERRAAHNLAIVARFALGQWPEADAEPDTERAMGIAALRGALDRYDRAALGLDDDV